MYMQCDGASMGSPLGVAFANFYMTHIENNIFDAYPDLKPDIYCRYVDDCFLVTNSVEKLPALIELFQSNSVLKFTHEIGNNRRLNFLDVNVTDRDNKYETSVHTKPKSAGILNANSECPQRYKEGLT